MRLSILVAAADNDVIGTENRLPWRLPDDMKRFKALSLGKPVIMGRHTFESIGRPLVGRTNIVVTRQAELRLEGCTVVHSLDDAIAAAYAAPEAIIVGGAQIYAQALPRTTTIYLTRVHTEAAGDVYFPKLASAEWRTIEAEQHPADERHAYPFTFLTLQRVMP